MTEALYRIVYCSRNTAPTGPEELRQILAASRVNNARDGVSGALLFSDGSFAQVLEGPLAAVERTFERIQCDLRHAGVTVLQFGPTEGRVFADWSMAEAATLRVQANGTVAETLDMLRQLISREAEWAMAG